MMGWYGGGMGGWAWVFMGLFWLVFLGLILWLVARILPVSSQGSSERRPERPEDILDRRFASGELDVETYQAQRGALLASRAGQK